MENLKETYNKSEHTNNANATSHYQLMTIGIIVGLVGIMIRFVSDSQIVGIVANILWVVGAVISIKAVLNILK